MKNIIAALLILITFYGNAQTTQIEIPETYELANIILAITEYGIDDKWEVQKNTEYYQEVIKYFEAMKKHPLLDSVNYSREKWQDYLSFRTDAVAFSFNNNGKLKRDFDFYTNEGHNPFDKHLDLVDDFVSKSNFRKFYQRNQNLYNRIINNYEDYNYIKETITFLDTKIGKSVDEKKAVYKIILSPLVFRMNCHRNLSEDIVADFPSTTEDFVNRVSNENNIEDRLNSNHLIFTEKDHEYINPISDKFSKSIKTNFNIKYWDNKSGYGDNTFNEYMTWAIYDLFLEKNFPEYSKKLSTFWQYQNASRGFFAQNLFSKKVKELYKKNETNNFEKIYEPLLKWTKKIEKKIKLPVLKNVDKEKFVKIENDIVQLEFSEKMNTKQTFGLQVIEYKNGSPTGNKSFITINDFKWSNNGKKLFFKLNTEFEVFVLIFNWWGIEKPLISKNEIFLEASSFVMLKK